MLNFKDRHFLSEDAKEFFQCWLLKLIGNITSALYMGKKEQKFVCLQLIFSPRIVTLPVPHREMAF